MRIRRHTQSLRWRDSAVRDTVNVASRMESQGVVDEIQVTQSTASLIEKDFQLIPRGAIPIKGKGDLPVFLVSRVRSAPNTA